MGKALLEQRNCTLVPGALGRANGTAALLRLVGYFAFIICFFSACNPKNDLNPDKQVLSFVLTGVPAELVHIDEASGSVEVTVAYGTLLAALTAEIQISPGASIVPSGSVPQDFTRPIYYTVTAANGSKKIYKVRVLSTAQSQPVITGFSKDTVRAGERLVVIGTDFGKFGGAIKTLIINSEGQEFSMAGTLADSTHIGFVVPLSTAPGNYKVRIIKNNLASVSERRLLVKIPAPEITAIKIRNVIQGDSIVLAGNYIMPLHYDYRLRLEGSNSNLILIPVVKEDGKLTFKTNREHRAGLYNLSLANVQESVTGQRAGQTLRIYDAILPFVKDIKNKQANYKPSESVSLLAVQFENIQTRFYQILLHTGGVDYNINGIYSAPEKLLSFSLPSGIKQGSYAISVFFISDSGQQLYDVDLDQTLTVKE